MYIQIKLELKKNNNAWYEQELNNFGSREESEVAGFFVYSHMRG